MPAGLLTPFGGLYALWALWAVFLFGGFAFGRLDDKQTRRMPAWTRMASSFMLVAAGWLWYAIARTSPGATFALLIAIGMTLGFLGDLFMARLIPVSPHVLGGIAAFGLGHVAYITGILLYSHQEGYTAPGARWGAWIIWLLIGLAGWYLVVYRGQVHTFLHRAALPYALLLASTAGFATGLALQAPQFAILAIGAALFLLSDLILAARLFNGAHFPLIDDVVWLTYGPGQMLIVYSIMFVLPN